LIFVATGEEKSASGRAIAPVTLALKGDVLTWSYTARDREKYNAVEAEWVDLGSAETRVKRIGEGERVFRMRHPYPNEEAAHAAATAKLAMFRMGDAKLDGLTVIGNPKIRAETPIELTGFHPSVPTSWVASSVAHVLNSTGFKTTIEAELPKRKALSGA
jgi:phage protein D